MKFLLIDVGYDCEELNEPLAIEALYSYLKIVPTVEPYLFCENHDTCSYPELFNKIIELSKYNFFCYYISYHASSLTGIV